MSNTPLLRKFLGETLRMPEISYEEAYDESSSSDDDWMDDVTLIQPGDVLFVTSRKRKETYHDRCFCGEMNPDEEEEDMFCPVHKRVYQMINWYGEVRLNEHKKFFTIAYANNTVTSDLALWLKHMGSVQYPLYLLLATHCIKFANMYNFLFAWWCKAKRNANILCGRIPMIMENLRNLIAKKIEMLAAPVKRNRNRRKPKVQGAIREKRESEVLQSAADRTLAKAKPPRRPRRPPAAKREEKREIKREIKKENQLERIESPDRWGFKNPIQVVNSGRGNPLLVDYIKCLLNPTPENMSRIPDASSVETALMHSCTEYIVYVSNTNLDPNNRNFTCLIRPILGQVDQVNHYKVLMPDYLANPFFDRNWALPISWQPQNATGKDIRIDQYMSLMTTPQCFFYGTGSGGAMTVASPLGPAPLALATNYGLNPQLLPGGPTTFWLPGGSYMVHFTVTATTAPGVPTLAATTNPAGVAIANLGFLATALQVSTSWAVNVLINGCQITLADPGLVLGTFSFFFITPTTYEGRASFQGGGVIEQIRPVAMSALFTTSLPAITNGGFVAANILAAGVDQTNYTSTVAAEVGGNIGQLEFYGPLSETNNAYRGPLEHGAYVWWAPEDNLDYAFYDVNGSNDRTYPTIAISGIISAANTIVVGTGQTEVGRVRINTIYEYTTETPLFSKRKLLGSSATMDSAVQICGLYPHAMENDEHESWFKKAIGSAWRMAKGLGQMAWDNRETILPAAMALI